MHDDVAHGTTRREIIAIIDQSPGTKLHERATCTHYTARVCVFAFTAAVVSSLLLLLFTAPVRYLALGEERTLLPYLLHFWSPCRGRRRRITRLRQTRGIPGYLALLLASPRPSVQYVYTHSRRRSVPWQRSRCRCRCCSFGRPSYTTNRGWSPIGFVVRPSVGLPPPPLPPFPQGSCPFTTPCTRVCACLLDTHKKAGRERAMRALVLM